MQLDQKALEASFQQYRRKQIAELRPYVEGEKLECVSISAADASNGSPKKGDMIARNPKNHADQWLVAEAYFADNFAPLQAVQPVPVITDELRGQIAYQLTKRLVIDMPTARACIDDALKGFVHAANATL